MAAHVEQLDNALNQVFQSGGKGRCARRTRFDRPTWGLQLDSPYVLLTVATHRKRGKMLVRERIDALLDPGTPLKRLACRI